MNIQQLQIIMLAQITPNKFNVSSSSQPDLLLEESAVSKSPFSPLDSAKKDSNLSDGSFLSEGISPFCSVSSDIVNEPPKVTYLTPSDASDYQPSSSLTTLTRLESLVSNVSLEQSYGRNLEKCVKGKNTQNRKQALSSVQRSSPYGTWSDTENSHCSPADMSGQQYHHSASPMRSSGMTPQGRYHYRSHSADMVSQSGYFFESNEFRSFENEHAMQQFDNVSQNAERIPHHMMQNDMLHGYPFSENLTDLDAVNKTQRMPKSWNARYQDMINSQMNPHMSDYSQPYDPFSRPDLMRSMSMPVVEKKKRGRPKGFKLNKNRSNSTSSIGNGKGAAYTFTFHVPTPVFKRLKLKKVFQKVNSSENIKLVRMHPKDARKYSLLKIGREVVKIPKLSDEVLIKHLGAQTNSMSSCDEQEEESTSEEKECEQNLNERKVNKTMSDKTQTEQSKRCDEINNDDCCDKGSDGKFLGVSLDEFIPQDTTGEESKNSESTEETCDTLDSQGKLTSEIDRKVKVKNNSPNVRETMSDVKNSKGEIMTNSVNKNNGIHLENSQTGQNRDSEGTLQDSDYRSIAAITLNSIIDRVIENTVNDFSNEQTNSIHTQNNGNGNLQQNQTSNQQVNSIRNFLPPQNNIVQYVTSDLPVFNYHRNNLKNVLHQDGHQKHLISSVERSFMDTFDVLNSPCEKSKLSKVVDVTSPFQSPLHQCKHQRRKANGFYKYNNSNPLILDPDYDDIEHIVLKDVSLTEATDGTLTPLKTRTPVAGRSPRSCFGQDQYRLFESDFVSKLGNLAADLEMPELLNEKDQSSSESNYSSYSDNSKLKNGDSNNNRKRKTGILSRLASDFNENYLGNVDWNSKRKKKSKLKLSNKKDKSSKGKKKEEIEGIDYIIIGKFKGVKKMVVKLNRIFIQEESVNLNDFNLTSEKIDGSDMTKLKTPCHEDSDTGAVNVRNNLNRLENNSYVTVNTHDKENKVTVKEGIPNKTQEPESNTKENEIQLSKSFWGLNPERKSLTDGDISKELLRKNKLSLSKRKINVSNLHKLSLEVLNGKPKNTINHQEINGLQEQFNGVKVQQGESVITHVKKENKEMNIDNETDGRDSPVIPVLTKESPGGPDSPIVPVINKELSGPYSPDVPVLTKEPLEEQCQVDSENHDIIKSGIDHFSKVHPDDMELGNDICNSEKKILLEDRDALSESLIEQKVTQSNLRNKENVGKIPENENSNSSKSSDMKESMFENDSDSRSSLDIVSPYMSSKEHGKIRKKKKNLTRNQRLQVAFVGTKPKRRKTNGTESKLMCSLSLLHQATLANLNEPSSCYTDDVDDYQGRLSRCYVKNVNVITSRFRKRKYFSSTT
ncbi:hypothetical protein KUTeg_007598 [Tegillarca granosa]|uniref:Uncharacterized protein n=1 Tax=Tegillarca granosa TaxID=220873 RepID=A0ABQ9FI95_TEGGR|nr:hypothetical protein KUTeg_007598 [Tegillarca granosa]